MSSLDPDLESKTAWPDPKDVLYWEDWAVRHPSLLFAGLTFDNADYLDTWQKLEADPVTAEVLRNLPIRHPLLWVESR